MDKSEIPCRFNFCRNPSCNFWASSRVSELQVYKKIGGYGDKCQFRHVEAEGKPSKRSKKSSAKGSVAILKFIQFGCVSEDSYPRKSIPHETWKIGTKHVVKFSKGTWRKKGAIARYYPNVCAS